MTPKIGLITSRVTPRLVKNLEPQTVNTPFGDANVLLGTINDYDVACINRNGIRQNISNNRVNFRANIWALRMLGVQRVISQNAIGSLNPNMRPGDIVIPHDFIDHTKGRELSLFDGNGCWVRVDMSEPFCLEMRETMISVAQKHSDRVYSKGVFVCVDGPRFETKSEIQVYQREGGDIIGTPMVPEAVIAREAELCYASIAPIMNYATGLTPKVIHDGPEGILNQYYTSGLHELVEDIIGEVVQQLSEERHCECGIALTQGFYGEKPSWLTGTSLG